MQSVSTNWKEQLGCYNYVDRPNFVPVSDVQLQYVVNDPDAQADASASDDGHESWSNVSEITSLNLKTFNPYVMLEHNSWILGANRKIKPAVIPDNVGYVGNQLSSANCDFSHAPTITIEFDTVYATTVPGITIQWSTAYDEFATDYTIDVYNGGTLLQTLTVADCREVRHFEEAPITNYNKIVINVSRWCLPYHRCRIEEVVIGAIKVYSGSDLMNYSHIQHSDLLSLELPESYIDFEIANVDGAWNPDNPTGLAQYLIQRQQITAKYGYEIGGSMEWIPGGTYYMNEWSTPSNGITATFKASSLIAFMGEKYAVSTTTLSLYNLATDALTQSNLPTDINGNNMWSLDSSLSGITVTISAQDFEHTNAEVLQLCANAARCVIRIGRDGFINVEPFDSTTTDYLIDEFVSYQNAEYELSDILRSVDVNEGQGTAVNDTTGEVQSISNALIQNSTVANAVATWVKNALAGRKTLSGEYRSDPRMDALDVITTKNKYASNTIVVTEIDYTYNGAFKGKYNGRVL